MIYFSFSLFRACTSETVKLKQSSDDLRKSHKFSKNKKSPILKEISRFLPPFVVISTLVLLSLFVESALDEVCRAF